jgi:DNA-directed RNA polymerase subunit RPC12/RpoP
MTERPWWCRECGVKNFEGWGEFCNECRAKERRHKEQQKNLEKLAQEKTCPHCGQKVLSNPKQPKE